MIKDSQTERQSISPESLRVPDSVRDFRIENQDRIDSALGHPVTLHHGDPIGVGGTTLGASL